MPHIGGGSSRIPYGSGTWHRKLAWSWPENLAELRALLPWVRVVHVQSVTRVGEALERRSLAESAEAWRDYLSVLGGRPGPYYALIEFVRHDQPAQFLADAATLKGLVAPFASQGD